MGTSGMRRALQDWFRTETRQAPDGDPRRTPECLRFHELSTYAEEGRSLTPEREAHVRACAWCRRGLSLARAHTAPATAPPGGWSPGVGELVSQWAGTGTRPDQAAGVLSQARFDAEGTLRLRWTDVPFEGPAHVRLSWRGAEVTLARGVVREGVLEIAEPHPELGVRSVEVPAWALRLEREAEA